MLNLSNTLIQAQNFDLVSHSVWPLFIESQSTLSVLDADSIFCITTSNLGCFDLDHIGLFTSLACFNTHIIISSNLLTYLALIILSGVLLMAPSRGLTCVNCAGRGKEQWVLPGKSCPLCGSKAPSPKPAPKPTGTPESSQGPSK